MGTCYSTKKAVADNDIESGNIKNGRIVKNDKDQLSDPLIDPDFRPDDNNNTEDALADIYYCKETEGSRYLHSRTNFSHNGDQKSVVDI